MLAGKAAARVSASSAMVSIDRHLRIAAYSRFAAAQAHQQRRRHCSAARSAAKRSRALQRPFSSASFCHPFQHPTRAASERRPACGRGPILMCVHPPLCASTPQHRSGPFPGTGTVLEQKMKNMRRRRSAAQPRGAQRRRHGVARRKGHSRVRHFGTTFIFPYKRTWRASASAVALRGDA
jgi:hypothetical protein